MIDAKRVEELREWINRAEGDGYDYVSDCRAAADLLAILDEHSKRGPGEGDLAVTEVKGLPDLTYLNQGVPAKFLGLSVTHPGPSHTSDDYNPALSSPGVISDERRTALEFIEDIDVYLRSGNGDWDIAAIPDAKAEAALATIRALLLSPAPQPAAIEGKSGCEMVNCRYAHRNEGGIATCLAPGDSCIRRQDCPVPQPSLTRADIEVIAGSLVAWGRVLGRAECGHETLPEDDPIPRDVAPVEYVIDRLRDLGVRIEGEKK